MQVIVLGSDKGKNYIDLLEFCSVRGIQLTEEKIVSKKECPICEGKGYCVGVHNTTDCPTCKGKGVI